MQLRLISPAGLVEHPVEMASELLNRPNGLVWLDIPTWDEQAERLLHDVFGFHPLAIRDCAQRNQVPKVHVYPDHVFLVLHAPQAGPQGTFTPSSLTNSSATGTWSPSTARSVPRPIRPPHGSRSTHLPNGSNPESCVRSTPTSCPTRWPRPWQREYTSSRPGSPPKCGTSSTASKRS